jgi:hypothetical protein
MGCRNSKCISSATVASGEQENAGAPQGSRRSGSFIHKYATERLSLSDDEGDRTIVGVDDHDIVLDAA